MDVRRILVFKHDELLEKKSRYEWLLKKQKTVFHPIITVSREPGSGGKPMAKKLAKSLGFKFYDRKLVTLISKDAKKKRKLIKSVDEKVKGFIEEILSGLNSSEKIHPTTFARSLWRVVLFLSRKGKVVVLGRGANFISPPKNTLRIRVVAPLKHRLKMAVKYEGHTQKEARRVIKFYHFDRKNFVKKHFHKNISNANYYDVTINTRCLSISDAVEISKEAFKQKFA